MNDGIGAALFITFLWISVFATYDCLFGDFCILTI